MKPDMQQFDDLVQILFTNTPQTRETSTKTTKDEEYEELKAAAQTFLEDYTTITLSQYFTDDVRGTDIPIAFVINRFARTLYGLTSINEQAAPHQWKQMDSRPEVVPVQIQQRFPNDKMYEVNLDIMFNPSSSWTKYWEGVKYAPQLENNHTITHLRIFYQGHRNRLEVKTIEMTELIKRIRNHIDKVEVEPQTTTIDPEQYQQAARQFNDTYGSQVTINTDGDPHFVFNTDAQSLAQTVVECAPEGYNARFGRALVNPVVMVDKPEYGTMVDIYSRNSNTQSCIQPLNPNTKPEAAIALVKAYLSR